MSVCCKLLVEVALSKFVNGVWVDDVRKYHLNELTMPFAPFVGLELLFEGGLFLPVSDVCYDTSIGDVLLISKLRPNKSTVSSEMYEILQNHPKFVRTA